AEDGIRDFHVTGVQTCALPISKLNRVFPLLFSICWVIFMVNRPLWWGQAIFGPAPRLVVFFGQNPPLGPVLFFQRRSIWPRGGRSEERRVGKEGSARWLPD